VLNISLWPVLWPEVVVDVRRVVSPGPGPTDLDDVVVVIVKMDARQLCRAVV
jgi:hypothetical protein